jgi:hypothetical protein
VTCDLRAVSCILFLVLIAGIVAPAAAGNDPAEPPVVLTVVSPKPNGTAWIDVVPPHVAVVGRVDAANGVRSVVVESSVGEVSCGNGTDFSCSVPVAEGNETITVTAVDTQGNIAKAVLNLTVRIGLPPPPLIARFPAHRCGLSLY